MLQLRVNGESRSVEGPVTVQEFLERNNLVLPFMAVARNGEVLHKHEYPQVVLADGDRLEVVRMVGGG